MRRGLVLVIALWALGITSVARSGTYSVTACDRAPGNQNNSWQSFNTDLAHIDVGQMCPPTQVEGEPSKADGLFATDDLTDTGNAAAGASAGWRFTAPPDTTVVAFRPDRFLGAYGDNGWVPALTADNTTLETCAFSFPDSRCEVGEAFGSINSLDASLPIDNARTITAGITCTGSEGCLTGGTLYTAWATLYGASVTLNETADPLVSGVSGSLWGAGPANGFHKAIENVIFQASDPSGISQATLLVDGHTAATQNGVCDYTYPIPCQSLGSALALDTTQIADGPHTITLEVNNAAQNDTQLTHSIVIANAPPPPPQNLQATRAVDSSDTVTWSDPAHVAAITQADYQLCSPTACQPPRGSSTLERLTGIHPPPHGRWSIKVWLSDAAGNVNPVNSASVTLPAPLALHVHHHLRARRLTVIASVPSGVRGLVTLGYRASRNSRTVALGSHRVHATHGRARFVFQLPLTAHAATKFTLTAKAPYAQLGRLVLVVPHRAHR